MAKVTFNGTAKEITVNDTETDIDVESDLYSEWKNWVLTSDNAKYEQALRTFGGDPISATQLAPKFFILLNGWKVRITTGNTVLIGVNLYTDDSSFPLIIEPTASGSIKNSDAVVITTGGSALTIEEHAKLMKALTKNEFIALK